MSESFDWNYPGLNWSHFHSLTNLLSLRNGGQAEPSSLSDTVLEEDWNPDDSEDGDTSSINTGFAHQISESGHGRLKRRFLDCLAEFAANKKGGTAVACSAMKEAEENVVIWLARNDGFSDMDKPVFDKLAKLLGLLSCNSADHSENLLWEEMISYHQSRIEHSYIPNLRASFKAYDAVCGNSDTKTPESSSVSDAMSALRSLLFDRTVDGTSTLVEHTRLVIASYNLRRTKNVEQVLYSSPNATSRSKSLWLDICLLARLQVAYQNFKDITLTLPSFKQVTIILVPRPLAPANPSQRTLNLKQTFDILRLDLTTVTTKALLGQNWTVAKIEREFAKRQKQKPNVHAEVQMLMSLNTNETSTSDLFPYFGCSKLSCFMCNRFLQSYGRFTTRGCHGRLFKPWTVPNVDGLRPGQADRTAKALISVQREVRKSLKASVKGHIRHERTSVIGGSSVLGGHKEERSQRQLQIDKLKIKAERERVKEKFKRQQEDAISSARDTCSAPAEDEPESDCDICMKPTRRRCNICGKDSFCSEFCQEKRSGRHLFTCSKRPLTSADYLWKSLTEDLIPEDEDVLEDFGFTNVLDGRRSSLFGVYQGLYRSGEVSAEDVHEWRVKGILIDKIKEFYYRIPEHCRGQYFPWFLQNTHVLERRTTQDEAEQKMLATFYDKARRYLDVEERDKTARELKPAAKGTSYNLLAGILIRASPNPIDQNYFSFGFVTCRGRHEESKLVDLYQLLLVESDGSFFYEFHNSRRGGAIPPATFTQFWKAYEAGTLIPLMDSKNLKQLRSHLPFLKAFLSVPPSGPHLSVWSLKQFLEISDPVDHPPDPPVAVDYGFVNCDTFEETCTLMEIYAKVLETANPLALHQACVAGELFPFASGFVRMEERWRPLMGNFYPLREVSELEEAEPESRSELNPVGGLELRPEPGSEPAPKADKATPGPPSLLSRLWRFVSGSANS